MNQIFSKNLIRFRKNKGLSLRQLSEKTDISYRMIYHYENDPSSVPLNNLKTLADALSVSIANFFDETESNREINDIDIRWIKKIKKIQQLPESDIKEINHHINSTIERVKLKKRIDTLS